VHVFRSTVGTAIRKLEETDGTNTVFQSCQFAANERSRKSTILSMPKNDIAESGQKNRNATLIAGYLTE